MRSAIKSESCRSSPAAAAASAAALRPPGIEHLPFHALCQLFDALERVHWKELKGGSGVGRNARYDHLLSSFFRRCDQHGGDPHPLFVLLVPDADLERRFDVKETALVNLLVKGFALQKTR